MTQTQAREYNRLKKLGMFLEAEGNVYSSFIPFANEVTSFGNKRIMPPVLLPVIQQRV